MRTFDDGYSYEDFKRLGVIHLNSLIKTWTISVNKGANFPFIKSQPKRIFFHYRTANKKVNLLTKLFYRLDKTFYYFRNFPSCNLEEKILIFSRYLWQYNLQYKSRTLCLSIRELKQRWRQGQRERQKSSRFSLAKQQLCTSITLFCTFLCNHCTTTTTWKCLTSFVENVNARQWLSFSFPELW